MRKTTMEERSTVRTKLICTPSIEKTINLQVRVRTCSNILTALLPNTPKAGREIFHENLLHPGPLAAY